MTSFADHVTEYLRLRRSFGFKLEEHERLCGSSRPIWMISVPRS